MEGKFNRRLDFSTAGCAAGLRRTAIDETAPFCYDRQRTKTGKRGIAVDLTEGGITGRLLRFALPLMAGNLLQQLYNVADTLIVGRFLGADALAAVGSAYSLMTFLTCNTQEKAPYIQRILYPHLCLRLRDEERGGREGRPRLHCRKELHRVPGDNVWLLDDRRGALPHKLAAVLGRPVYDGEGD